MASLSSCGRGRAAAAAARRRPGPIGASAAWPLAACCGEGRRWIHQGYVKQTLEGLRLPRKSWLKEVDQAPEKSNIRRQKDKYMRELGLVHQDMQALFQDDHAAQRAVKPYTADDLKTMEGSAKKREDINEAMRMYKILRPDAPPFYEEDSMLSMKAKMNRILTEEAGVQGDQDALERVEDKNALFDPFKCYLPVVNQRAFLLALESIIASVAEDVETMCELAGVPKDALPAADDPLRFKHLLDMLFGAFPLKKDPSKVEQFMNDCWPRLQSLLPMEIARLDDDVVAEWLRGHLTRVQTNQRRLAPTISLHAHATRFGDEEYYSFAEDFAYDDDPMPGLLTDERNLDFPLHKAGEFMASFLSALSNSPVAHEHHQALRSEAEAPAAEVAGQFQDLVWDLEKIGLRNWLRMDVS